MTGLKIKSPEDLKKQILEEKMKKLVTPRETDPTEFNENCQQFRELCYTIGQLIGDENFKGGFDEIYKLYTYLSKVDITTVEGLTHYAQVTQLVFSWIALNESCKYLGSKLGYNQPEWWYQCWSNQTNTEEISSENI